MPLAKDVKTLLTDFRTSRADVRFAAFVDVGSCMVLGTSTRVTRNQEIMDRIARDCAAVLDSLKASPLHGGGTVVHFSARPDELLLFLAPDPASDEALALAFDPDAEFASIRQDALALGASIFETDPEAAA